MVTTVNGSARKSLSEQIDRLDSILDGLADGLSGAVADAVRQTVGLAVQEAVRAVLTEVLNNPAVLEKLRGSAATAAPAATATAAPKAPRHDHVSRVTGQVNAWACAGWARMRQSCGAALRGAAQAADTAWQHGRLIWSFRAQLLVAVAAGMLSGTAAFMAGPWVAATAGTVAGFTAAASAKLAVTLRRMLNRFTASDVPE